MAHAHRHRGIPRCRLRSRIKSRLRRTRQMEGSMIPKRVLVACEYSGIVRNAFLEAGHDAWSCDLLPSEDGSNRHIRGDARDILNDGWDLRMVAHPPCTRLCNSGVRWLSIPPPGKTIDEMQLEL